MKSTYWKLGERDAARGGKGTEKTLNLNALSWERRDREN